MFSSKTARRFAFSTLAFLTACTSHLHPIAPPPDELAPELKNFHPHEPDRFELANGLTVFYLKDEEVPIIKGQLFFRGGGLWEPETRAGIVSAMGDLLRKGGAGSLNADELDLELEKKAAHITSQFGPEFGTVRFSALTRDLDAVFALFSDVVLKPRFEKDRLNLWKGQTLEAIRRRKEDPDTVAGISIQQLLYQGSPFGRVVSPEQVSKINRTQIRQAYERWVRPQGSILVLTGDLSLEKAHELVENTFGSWSSLSKEELLSPTIGVSADAGVYFIELPFPQASIMMGQLGVPRLTPDYAAIDAFNEVFGSSGFGSRLMKRVRTELGLAYTVGGGIQPALVKGMNVISVQTKSKSAAEAIEEGIKVLAALQTENISEVELAEKKRAVANSFVFNFESPEMVASRKARFQLLHYPADYDSTYLSKLAAVTPLDVKEVAAKRWGMGSFVTVVVGDNAAYTDLEKRVHDGAGPLRGVKFTKLNFDSSLELP